ncbi:DUF1552 domain-containing protein [Urbifossiella limnaea]|uniref:DUF1552 domain-containing protein n=1 Tax=Urbifossiella limnaea TaxID=2528023 RepID=A0A517XNC3_9BACT|nr:DUF1552 domain-containing protein [Urbifossiella limnaea]QDU19013.1 hypothetical protein ETAA1_09150 [Urbifossiella limnaea]
MTSRRAFLQTSAAAGASALLNFRLSALDAPPSARLPMRFVFMHRGNGLFPHVMVPRGLSRQEQEQEQRKEAFAADLGRLDLPDWMIPLAAHKNDLAVVQGLSGKMCTTGHHSWCSALGVMRANERPSSIKWATADFELARMFPSPVEHVELAVFPLDGGNPRGNLDGIAQGFSARGREQPNYAFGSPRVAVRELFRSVAESRDEQVRYRLERQLLEFTGGREGAAGAGLTPLEARKVQGYAESIDAVRERNRRVEAMADRLRRHVPRLDAKFLAQDMTTLDRQTGHTEVLLAALVSGLTNVVAFTVDELGHHYTGIPGIEGERVNMHSVGHNQAFGGVEATEIRARTERHHMSLINTIVTRLKGVPEGDGTMFDNTTIFYFPDGGETHHAVGTEFPFLVVSGRNARLKLGNRYVRLPFWGRPGHKTLGNWWTTLLNAYGNPVAHYGELDAGLARFVPDQRGPIREFLA